MGNSTDLNNDTLGEPSIPRVPRPPSYASVVRNTTSAGIRVFPQSTNPESQGTQINECNQENSLNSCPPANVVTQVVGNTSAYGNSISTTPTPTEINPNLNPQFLFTNCQQPTINSYSNNILNSHPNHNSQQQSHGTTQSTHVSTIQSYISALQQPNTMGNGMQMQSKNVISKPKPRMRRTREAVLKSEMYTDLVCYFTILFSAIITLVVYKLVEKHYIPPLDLYEVGNGWAYTVLYVSCDISIATTAFGLLHFSCFKTDLSSVFIALMDALLFLSAIAVLFVGVGATKSWASGRGGPDIETYYGKYVRAVCRGDRIEDFPSTVIYDAAKCEATHYLTVSIYCMYVWAVFLLTASVAAIMFGLGAWKNLCTPKRIV